jgi:hypothetical protein
MLGDLPKNETQEGVPEGAASGVMSPDDGHEAHAAQLERLDLLSQNASRPALAVQVFSAAVGQSSASGSLTTLLGSGVATGAPVRDAQRVLADAIPTTAIPGYWGSLQQNAETWAHEISGAPFWVDAKRLVSKWSDENYAKRQCALLGHGGLPNFTGKKLPRLQEKVLGEVSRGKIATLYPDGGARVPRISDLVRVRIPTLYLDGVAFLSGKLKAHLNSNGMEVQERTEARLAGYYASHLYFTHTSLFRFTKPEPVPVMCEIQIATELSTTIWERTHGSYELARVANNDGNDWQWNPDDPRFIAAQLAHMIHLADGLVVQLREAVGKRKGSKE